MVGVFADKGCACLVFGSAPAVEDGRACSHNILYPRQRFPAAQTTSSRALLYAFVLFNCLWRELFLERVVIW